MSQTSTAPIDLDAYLARIGYRGELRPTGAVLRALHLAHKTHVPFENLDILLGRPIRLDPRSLQAKLVHGRRGGYCFEQNTLFGLALEQVGFKVTRLAARVRHGSERVLPRTHMLLEVEADGAAWLADVGFGADGPLLPVPMAPGEPVRQFAWSYRMRTEPGARLLQLGDRDGWHDMYAFGAEPQLPVDFEVANHYTATHPESRFVQTLTAQRSTPEIRYRLVNWELTMDDGRTITSRAVGDSDELIRVLCDTFGLEFPPGTRFNAAGLNRPVDPHALPAGAPDSRT
jgi:N-hydroxyarylamine O-acetyltransferase